MLGVCAVRSEHRAKVRGLGRVWCKRVCAARIVVPRREEQGESVRSSPSLFAQCADYGRFPCAIDAVDWLLGLLYQILTFC